LKQDKDHNVQFAKSGASLATVREQASTSPGSTGLVTTVKPDANAAHSHHVSGSCDRSAVEADAVVARADTRYGATGNCNVDNIIMSPAKTRTNMTEPVPSEIRTPCIPGRVVNLLTSNVELLKV
jgi:hypothetical protein